MSNPFLGEIRLLPYNFAPRGWAFCNGQILPISQNTALFSLLGTTYGGNGTTTFALPDLRGRAAVSSGQGPGLSLYSLGEVGGSETITLLTTQMPSHFHQTQASSDDGNSGVPTNNYPAAFGQAIYSNTANGPGGATTAAGSGQPHENRPPYLVLNYCIALQGIFPSRN